MAQLLKGLPVAKAIAKELSERSGLLNEKGVKPTLAILRVGSRPDDLSYEKGAVKRCAECGIEVRRVIFSDFHIVICKYR